MFMLRQYHGTNAIKKNFGKRFAVPLDFDFFKYLA